MKGPLNASFHSSNLKASRIYKSASIHPFHYAPQNNRKLIKEAANEMDKERNEINWRIVEKDRKQISVMIEGVGRVNSMEEVAMTCVNIRNPVPVDRNHSISTMYLCKASPVAQPFIPVIRNN